MVHATYKPTHAASFSSLGGMFVNVDVFACVNKYANERTLQTNLLISLRCTGKIMRKGEYRSRIIYLCYRVIINHISIE